MDSAEYMDTVEKGTLQALASELVERMGDSLTQAVREKLGALASETDFAALEPRQLQILDLLDALVTQKRLQEQLWSEITGRNARVVALERDLEQTRADAAQAQADLNAAQGFAAGLERQAQAASLQLQTTREEMIASEALLAQSREQTGLEAATLREALTRLDEELQQTRAAAAEERTALESAQAKTAEFEAQARAADAKQQAALDEKNALEAMLSQSKRDSAAQREALVALEAALERARAAAATSQDASQTASQADVEAAQAKAGGLERELRDVERRLETTRAEKQALEDANAQAQRELALDRAALNQEKEQVARAASDSAAALTATRARTTELEERLQDAATQLQAALNAKTAVGAQLAEARVVAKALEVQAAALAVAPTIAPVQPACSLPSRVWGAFALLFLLILVLGGMLYRELASKNARDARLLAQARAVTESAPAASSETQRVPTTDDATHNARVLAALEELKQRIASLSLVASTPERSPGSAAPAPTVEAYVKIGQSLDAILRALDSIPARSKAETLPLLAVMQRKLDALEQRAGASPLAAAPASAPQVPDKAASRPLRAVIGFGVGEVGVPEDDGQQTREIAAKILDSGAKSVLVVGYADSSPLRGELQTRFEDNVTLSRTRAQSVARLLVKSGVNPRSVVTYGVGPAMPAAPNDTHENRARNRRVEIIAW